jgi:flavin-dependent dehydrogenase
VVEGESARANFTPFLIPVGGPLRRPGYGRVILAGDAGGFVNGFTAEGIYYAMVSGELAARSVVASAASAVTSLVRRYRHAVDHEIGAELRDSVLIQRYLFADRRRIARVVAGARRAPEITRLILDFAVGGLSYRALRRRVCSKAPLLGGRLLWERLRTLMRPNAEAAGTA